MRRSLSGTMNVINARKDGKSKAAFYFPALRPNRGGFCRSSVYRSRTYKTLTEKVAEPVYLFGNKSSAFRDGLGTRY